MRRYGCTETARLVLLLNVVLIISACTTVQVGLTYIPHSQDEVEEPLGVVRLDRKFSEHWVGSCEHISSAFTRNDRISLDHCGIFYEF